MFNRLWLGAPYILRNGLIAQIGLMGSVQIVGDRQADSRDCTPQGTAVALSTLCKALQ